MMTIDSHGKAARLVAGRDQESAFFARGTCRNRFLLRRLQDGEVVGMPASRPLPEIGASCHELRIVDRDATWRVVYHVANDAIVLLEIFSKKTRTLPRTVVASAKRRLKEYLRLAQEN